MPSDELTTSVWKSLLCHSPVKSRAGRASGGKIYFMRSVVSGSVYVASEQRDLRLGEEKRTFGIGKNIVGMTSSGRAIFGISSSSSSRSSSNLEGLGGVGASLFTSGSVLEGAAVSGGGGTASEISSDTGTNDCCDSEDGTCGSVPFASAGSGTSGSSTRNGSGTSESTWAGGGGLEATGAMEDKL
jgi:hypothetical protein